MTSLYVLINWMFVLISLRSIDLPPIDSVSD